MKSNCITKISILTALVLFLSVTFVSAYGFDVSPEVRNRAERVTIGLGEEEQVGDYTIRYDSSEAVYTLFSVKLNDGDWVQLASDGSGVATGFLPPWTHNVVIHIEKIGRTDDLNYVDDPSQVTIWVDDNSSFIYTCGDFIDDPKNIGINTGNFYSNENQNVRHQFTDSYNYPPEILFTYAFDFDKLGLMLISTLNIYEGQDFSTPVQSIPFSICGQQTFTYNGDNFVVEPFFFMENGNWDVTLREVDRVCPEILPRGDGVSLESVNRPSDVKIINLGLYDDERKPLTRLSARNVEKFGDESVKVDFKTDDESDWNTYLFDDCQWKTVNDGPPIRLAGLYGKEAEFYVDASSGRVGSPVNRYNPFWDRILEILGRY